MALRVLLADESSTIKKVLQLALSDFDVEVRSVPIGTDVLAVAKNFKPDIIFADILLTKKTGYEVSLEIKNDVLTKHIPVVLMWSGFMEVDESKLGECHADARLEKPFDAEGLRQVVTDLVQKTKSNPISSFLSFPRMPDFEESSFEGNPALNQDVEEIFNFPEPEMSEPAEFQTEDFSAVPLPSAPLREPEEKDEGGWSHQDLTKFKINIPADANEEPTDFASKFVIPQDEDLSSPQITSDGDFEEVTFIGSMDSQELHKDAKPKTPQKLKSNANQDSLQKQSNLQDSIKAGAEKTVKDQMLASLKRGPSAAQPNAQSQGDIDPDMMEKIIQQQAREAIESICWKILPEIAEKIVREEINKILRDSEKSI